MCLILVSKYIAPMHHAGGKVLVDFATRLKRLPSNVPSKSVQMVQKCNNRCDFMSKIRYFKFYKVVFIM